MSLTSQPAAYLDCYELFARAADTPAGVRTPFPTEDRAKHFQLRMHQARKIQRDQSRRIYPPTSPLYDTSEYDSLQVQIRPDGLDDDSNREWWVYVRPTGERLTYIEPLDPNEALPPITQGKLNPADVLQLTHQKESTES